MSEDVADPVSHGRDYSMCGKGFVFCTGLPCRNPLIGLLSRRLSPEKDSWISTDVEMYLWVELKDCDKGNNVLTGSGSIWERIYGIFL